MVPKNVFAAALMGAALLAGNGPSAADEYKPDQFLSLDLSKAVLSPKRLGPETQFAPVPVEASSGTPAAQAAVAPDVAPQATPHVTLRKTRTAQAPDEKARPAKTHEARARNERPRGEARTRLARRHSNPLDAMAFDRRVQVWPCRSGGICNWQRQ